MDYLFLAFNTSTAFSPTDTAVLSRWAKVGMMLQSLISLMIVALLAARRSIFFNGSRIVGIPRSIGRETGVCPVRSIKCGRQDRQYLRKTPITRPWIFTSPAGTIIGAISEFAG